MLDPGRENNRVDCCCIGIVMGKCKVRMPAFCKLQYLSGGLDLDCR